MHYWDDCLLEQGFSTFWYSRTPKSELYPSTYPQIRLMSPSQKLYPNKLHLSGFAYPFGLLMYPLWPAHVPLGVRIPQVENRCSRALTQLKKAGKQNFEIFGIKLLFIGFFDFDSTNFVWNCLFCVVLLFWLNSAHLMVQLNS